MGILEYSNRRHHWKGHQHHKTQKKNLRADRKDEGSFHERPNYWIYFWNILFIFKQCMFIARCDVKDRKIWRPLLDCPVCVCVYVWGRTACMCVCVYEGGAVACSLLCLGSKKLPVILLISLNSPKTSNNTTLSSFNHLCLLNFLYVVNSTVNEFFKFLWFFFFSCAHILLSEPFQRMVFFHPCQLHLYREIVF